MSYNSYPIIHMDLLCSDLDKVHIRDIRNQGLDKFYTIPEFAKHCIHITTSLFKNIHKSFDLIVEPSAGNGSFSLLLNTLQLSDICNGQIHAIDLLPEHPSIQQQNFFTYIPPSNFSQILVIGNPPFGKSSSLAVQFFNHAAKWASAIAMILPRTFRRPSIQNKLDLNFTLIHDEDVPTSPCQFIPAMGVKCCFQIWIRTHTPRIPVIFPTTHPDWEFLPFGPKDAAGQPTPPRGADFALRAYGGKIGDIRRDGLDMLRPKSWHWIKSRIDVDTLVERMAQLDYSDSTNTARQNSMGKADLVRIYMAFIDSI